MEVFEAALRKKILVQVDVGVDPKVILQGFVPKALTNCLFGHLLHVDFAAERRLRVLLLQTGRNLDAISDIVGLFVFLVIPNPRGQLGRL